MLLEKSLLYQARSNRGAQAANEVDAEHCHPLTKMRLRASKRHRDVSHIGTIRVYSHQQGQGADKRQASKPRRVALRHVALASQNPHLLVRAGR